MQVTCINRDTHVNFMVTDSACPTELPTYDAKMGALFKGTRRLPPRFWVFLLCTGLTMMVLNGCDTGQVYMPLTVCEAGEDTATATAQVCLARWLHRVHKPGNRDLPAVAEVMQQVDPSAEHFGCERLVWARHGEAGGPNDQAKLDKKVTDAAAAFRRKTATKGTKGKRCASQQKTQDESINSARQAVTEFGRGRYRADDAFHGIAYCEIMSPKIAATPVRVLPVLGTERDDQWRAPPGTGAARRLAAFSASQGFKISSFHQLRLDLNAMPRGSEDE